jgi:fatty acid desaturase
MATVHMAAKLAAQGIVLAAFVLRFGPAMGAVNFALFWVVPLFSIMPTIIRMRIVAEHFAPELHGDHPGLFVSRTSASSRLEAYFIGAAMEYHFEHHLIPSIPHRRLVRLHRLLVERGFFDRPAAERDRCLSGGYVSFWWRLLRGRIEAGAGSP